MKSVLKVAAQHWLAIQHRPTEPVYLVLPLPNVRVLLYKKEIKWHTRFINTPRQAERFISV